MTNKIEHKYFFYLFVFTLFFGVLLHNMIGLKFMDEISGFILLVFYCFFLLTTKNERPNIGVLITLLIFTFYLCYSIFVSNNTYSAIILDFLIQIRPYLTFFIVAQIAPSFSDSQKLLLKRLCFFMWLFFIPIGIYGLINPTLLYSLFEQPTNYIASISCLSFVYLYCSSFSIRERFIFIIMFSAGLFAASSIFYSIFLLTCGILLYFHHSDILKLNLRTGVAIGVIALIVLHIARVQITTYLFPVNNFAAEYDLPVRSILYQTSIDIVKDFFPLGSGLASFGTDASGLYYSKIYTQYGLNSIEGLSPQEYFSVSDSYYPSLAQFGIIGIILYLFFWGGVIFKSFVRFKQNKDIQSLVLILILTSFVLIENLSDSFLTSNNGYYMMMFLGVLFGKKKRFFYTRENNKKIEINPLQANIKTDNTVEEQDENKDASDGKKVYQMPPIPIREDDLLEKDIIKYTPYSLEKNEIDNKNESDDDEYDYYDDEDEYDENDFDDEDDEEELTEAETSSNSKNIRLREATMSESDAANQNNDMKTDAGPTNSVLQAEETLTNKEDVYSKESLESTTSKYNEAKDTLSNLNPETQKGSSVTDDELQSFSPLVDEDEILILLSSIQKETNKAENNPSEQALQETTNKSIKTEETPDDNIILIDSLAENLPIDSTDQDTESNQENSVAQKDDLLTHTPLVDDNTNDQQNLPSTIQNEKTKTESNASAEVIEKLVQKTDIKDNGITQDIPDTILHQQSSVTIYNNKNETFEYNTSVELPQNTGYEKVLSEDTVLSGISFDNILTEENDNLIEKNISGKEQLNAITFNTDDHLEIPASTSPSIDNNISLYEDYIPKQEIKIPDTTNIDIEKQIFAQQTKLSPAKPESDLVKQYREIVEEHISKENEKEKENQEAEVTNDYLKYIEELLKPIKQENTRSEETNKENNETDEQIDYII